jgi:2TM domain-containing protein
MRGVVPVGENTWKEVSIMVSTTEPRREQAIQRIKAQKIHIFSMNLLVYVIVNAALVVAVAAGITRLIPPGFFWPSVSIVVWGAALAIWGYRTFRGHVYPEEQVQREMKMLP